MLQIINHTVAGKFAFNGVSRAAHTTTLGASALNHKTGNDPMKD
jgi:hypothetical protein